MNIGSYPKKEIACQQIETALRLFFEKGDLSSGRQCAVNVPGTLAQEDSEVIFVSY